MKTTISNPAAPCPKDRVNREFHAPRPNALWLSDFTYVATWAGFVYVALVIDAFARRIVGWRVSRSMQAQFVLDALEQALHERHPVQDTGLVHHSDRGSQYLSIKYTERLAEAGIEPSVGSVGDSYDNALAETVIGLFKTEVIHRRGPWRSLEAITRGFDSRYIVTSLKGDARHLYENVYCARRQAENLIKLHKAQLASGRTSCQSPVANQVRLVLHTAACWLMLALRDAVPAASSLARVEFATLRLRLLKLGARVVEKAARIHLASACPDARCSDSSPDASPPPGHK